MRSPFLVSLIATVLLLTVLAIAYALREDPYGIYGATGDPGEVSRVDLFWHTRLYKPYRLRAEDAEHLFIGSSRTGRLVPGDTWPGQQTSYNGALPGITLYEMLRVLQHAQANAPLQSVVLGLEYYMFRNDKEQDMPGFADARLERPAPTAMQRLRHVAQLFVDRWATLYSRSAIKDSVLAARGDRGSQRTFYEDGSWDTDAGEFAGRFVYHLLTNQKYREFRFLSKQRDYALLEDILGFAEEHGIEVTLLISPSHTHILSAVELAGELQAYRDWQREVVELATRSGVPVYGLETNREMMLEPITPDPELFHDGVHYSRKVGRAISRCLPRAARGAGCEDPLVMTRLTPDSLRGYQATFTTLVENYATTNPADHAMLLRSLERAMASDVPVGSSEFR